MQTKEAEQHGGRLIARIQQCDAKSGKWSEWKDVTTSHHPWVHTFPKGGTMRLWPNIIDAVEQEALSRELIASRLFHQYKIQVEKSLESISCFMTKRHQILLRGSLGDDAAT